MDIYYYMDIYYFFVIYYYMMISKKLIMIQFANDFKVLNYFEYNGIRIIIVWVWYEIVLDYL